MNELGPVGGNVELDYRAAEPLKGTRARKAAWKLLMAAGMVTVALGFYKGYQGVMMVKDFIAFAASSKGGAGTTMVLEVAIIEGVFFLIPVVTGIVLYVYAVKIGRGSSTAVMTALYIAGFEALAALIWFLNDLVNLILDAQGGWATWESAIKTLLGGLLAVLLGITLILLVQVWRGQRERAALTAGL